MKETSKTTTKQISRREVKYQVKETKLGTMVFLDSYSYDKAYLNFDMQSVEGKDVVFDCNGIPKLNISRRGEYHYYPITIAIYGLEQVSKYYKTQDPRHLEKVRAVANFLAQTQNTESGAWKSDFEYFYAVRETGKLEPGWTSALAQGFCISCLVRAYYLFDDIDYLAAVEKGVLPFYEDVENGGVLSRIFDKYPWYEEYTTPNKSHILNGFMFSLLGLYDGFMLTGSTKYSDRFEIGLESLRHCLSMFDLKDISAYDLTHITIPGNPAKYHIGYHFTHIRLLSALLSIEEDQIIRKVLERWISYSQGNKSYFRLVESNIDLQINSNDGFIVLGSHVTANVNYNDPSIDKDEIEYAFYLMKDGQKFKRSGFGKQSFKSFEIEEPGEYYVAIYIRDVFGNKTGANSEKIIALEEPPKTEIHDISLNRSMNAFEVEVNATGIKLKFAFYVFLNGKIYKKYLYDKNNSFYFEPTEPGEYQFECYVKSLELNPVIRRTQKVVF